jgi:hypothetical protein
MVLFFIFHIVYIYFSHSNIFRFGDTLNEHAAQLNDVESLPDVTDVSMFSVVGIKLKDSVKKTCEDCIDMLHKILPEMAADKRTDVNATVRNNYQVCVCILFVVVVLIMKMVVIIFFFFWFL